MKPLSALARECVPLLAPTTDAPPVLCSSSKREGSEVSLRDGEGSAKRRTLEALLRSVDVEV